MKKTVAIAFCVTMAFLFGCTEVDPEQTENYRLGYDAGYEAGYSEGYEVGQSNGYDTGVTAGYDSGYDDGHSDGYTSGHDIGYTDGYYDGFDVGSDAVLELVFKDQTSLEARRIEAQVQEEKYSRLQN